MKRALIMLCKIAFWFVFFWNSGVIHDIASSIRSGNLTPEQEIQGRKLLDQFGKSKIAEIRKAAMHGHDFAPADYFRILKEKMIFVDSLNLRGVFSPCLDSLYILLDEKANSEKFKSSDMTYACQQSGITGFHYCSKEPIHWEKLPPWLQHQYWSMLPFVFLLFLIWIWEGKQSSVLSIKSPICFLFLILIHPLYITTLVLKWWRKMYRETAAEVEVRRRRVNLFAKLSSEERLLIKTFAESKATFREFIFWAETFGPRRRCIGVALVVVLIGSIATKLEGATIHHNDQTVKTCIIQNGHVQTMFADYDIGTSPPTVTIAATFDWIFVPVEQISVTCKAIFHLLLSNGYPQTREPVPIVAECTISLGKTFSNIKTIK